MKFLVVSFILCLSGVLHADATHKHAPQKYQKPGAPVALAAPDFIQFDPQTRASFDVEIHAPSTGELIIATKPKEGLAMQAVNETRFDLSAGAPSLSLNFDANAEGLYHVMFHARLIKDGVESSRVFGVPVYVGNPQAKTEKSSATHIIMKAQETVH